MPRRRDPFQMALVTLRELAQGGAFAPGSPIVIIEEARRLGLSATPVREALAWLSGEGLIERAASGGYLAPRCDAATVRDRFGFRLYCLASSLDITEPLRDQRVAPTTETPRRTINEQFDRLVRGAGNAVLVEAFQRVGRQLRKLEAAEREVFTDLDAEAVSILRILDNGHVPTVRDALAIYHKRRIEAAGLLVLHAENSRPSADHVET